ncbi:MAG: hypothetical protein M3Y91_15150, partial [Actinomycetota bacterium]|nr:hypothetical protein [Actinomycetota bacterium]
EGAATSTTTALGNTVGSQKITGIVTNGFSTDGPQLLSATRNQAAGTVTYTFNQPEVSGFGAPDATAFFVLNSSGVPTFGTGTASISGNTVIVTFGSGNLANAVNAGVTSGANGTETAGNANFGTINSNFDLNAPGDVPLS